MKRILASIILVVLLAACAQAVESPKPQEPLQLPAETETLPTETPVSERVSTPQAPSTNTPPVSTQDSTTVVFTKSEQNLGNARTFGVAIEDIDLDNDNDIFVANYIGPSGLWLNDGNGVFSPNSQLMSSAE